MSTPVHRAPTRQSSAVVTAARQRQEQNRAGGSSGNPAQRALLQMQSSAGNRAATAAVQRVRATTLETIQEEDESAASVAETPAPAPAPQNQTAETQTAETQTAETGGAPSKQPKKKKRKRDWGKPLVDRYKKYAEQIDAWVKGVQTPTNAGVSQTATAAGDAAAMHGSAVSGISAGSENLAAELGNAGLSALDASQALDDAKQAGDGAAYHTAIKKAKMKGTDAVVGTVNSGSYAAAIARETAKLKEAANAAMAAEASGSLSAAVGTAKGARSVRRVKRAIRKYKDLKALGDPRAVHAASLAQLRDAVRQCEERVAAAYAKLEPDPAGPERSDEEIFADLDAYTDELDQAREAARALEDAEAESVQADVETLHSAQKYARKKTRRKIGKEAVSGLGETTKAAAGGVTVAVAAGALASTPVGWGLAAGGGGLLLLLAGYKGFKAARGRYNEKRHPELHGERNEEGEFPEAASEKEAWKHALAFWRKVEKGERQAKARDIYRLAAGPDVPGSAGTTAQTRADARLLLKKLKAGPDDHKVSERKWEDNLNDPDQKAAWIKEIAEQLASG